jgi:hypothetical protein
MSGNTNEEVIKLLPALKEELKEAADGVSDEYLLNFLHWKPNIRRAADRFHIFQKWHTETSWANTDLKLTQCTKLKKHVSSNVIIAPESLVAKDGSTVLVGRLRNNDMTDGRRPEDVCRMILYVIDRAIERQSTKEHGIILFHDLKGVGKNNVDINIAKLLLGAIIGHFPLKIKGIYLYNAPLFFRGLFSMIMTLLFSKKLRQRVHFVTSLDDIHDVIDRDLLLVEHGGKLDFDVEDWVERQIEREESGDLTSILM